MLKFCYEFCVCDNNELNPDFNNWKNTWVCIRCVLCVYMHKVIPDFNLQKRMIPNFVIQTYIYLHLVLFKDL